MRRLRCPALAVAALSLAVLAVGSSGAGNGNAATSRTPQVVIVKKGLINGGEGSGYAQYGLVLRNRSTTRDALNVTVTLRGLDSGGRAFTSSFNDITVIPAATSFVVTGSLIWNVSLNIARISTHVHVGKAKPRGRRLPPLRNVHLTQQGQEIVGTLTNPYRKRLPSSTTIYGIFLDSAGNIIATDNLMTDAVVSPGASVAFDLFGQFATSEQADAVRSIKVSVDPCGGGLSLDAPCPIAGAQFSG